MPILTIRLSIENFLIVQKHVWVLSPGNKRLNIDKQEGRRNGSQRVYPLKSNQN